MPKFDMRVVQIDLARQIETVETVCRFMDVAAKAGMNAILMYLEDRVKTATYPYASDEESYSPAQVREMVAYGEKLGLELIPVVSPIGHTERFLAHPELKHLAELRGGIAGMFTQAGAAVHRDTCPNLPETKEFFKNYITEVAALFPSKYFHLGFDEIHDMGFCELCKDTPVADLFYGALKYFYDVLKGLGKEVMIWDDMTEQQPRLLELLPRDIILCAWFYEYTNRYPVARFNTSRSYDYFTEYERLGFRYLACPWCRGSLDTITAYAAKCHPMGMLMTNWEMSDYQQIPLLYPVITYAGLLWNDGEPAGFETVEKAAAQYTDTAEGAKALATAMTAISYVVPGLPGENASYPVPWEDAYQLMSTLPLVESALDKAAGDADVLDAYRVKIRYVKTRFHLWRTGYDLHEYRAGDSGVAIGHIRAEAAKCREEVAALHRECMALWQRCRPGIAAPQIEQILQAMAAAAAWLEETAATATTADIGRLVVRFDLPEFTAACTTQITVQYADGTSLEAARGTYKAMFVRVIQYDYSFEIPADKVPQAVTLTVWGYGASGFRFVSAMLPGKKEYVPSGVACVHGQVEHPEFMLTDDSRSAIFNEQDMLQFFVNKNSGKKTNSVTLTLKEW